MNPDRWRAVPFGRLAGRQLALIGEGFAHDRLEIYHERLEIHDHVAWTLDEDAAWISRVGCGGAAKEMEGRGA